MCSPIHCLRRRKDPSLTDEAMLEWEYGGVFRQPGPLNTAIKNSSIDLLKSRSASDPGMMAPATAATTAGAATTTAPAATSGSTSALGLPPAASAGGVPVTPSGRGSDGGKVASPLLAFHFPTPPVNSSSSYAANNSNSNINTTTNAATTNANNRSTLTNRVSSSSLPPPPPFDEELLSRQRAASNAAQAANAPLPPPPPAAAAPSTTSPSSSPPTARHMHLSASSPGTIRRSSMHLADMIMPPPPAELLHPETNNASAEETASPQSSPSRNASTNSSPNKSRMSILRRSNSSRKSVERKSVTFSKVMASSAETPASEAVAKLWLAKEVKVIVDCIRKHGSRNSFGQKEISFGQLFTKASDRVEALTGTLLAAKRNGIVTYDGELLLEHFHRNVVITLNPECEDVAEFNLSVYHHQDIGGRVEPIPAPSSSSVVEI
eukprot:m.118773 g.118773  ORF g.118773 m.118773 type:complete len:436 (+) comp16132_c0_seq2:380-1687(+)